MSKLKLNAIATQALLDNEFQAAILNGHVQERLSAFQLNDEEKQAVSSIQAMDLDQFIRHLSGLIQPSATVA
ncbi:MAG TPA: hypothetical protein VJ182_02575 [Anaerolineales bacterium]|nr:hypothetical protein [Anaerolineales bacterium]